jgi:hypothetical protein
MTEAGVLRRLNDIVAQHLNAADLVSTRDTVGACANVDRLADPTAMKLGN